MRNILIIDNQEVFVIVTVFNHAAETVRQNIVAQIPGRRHLYRAADGSIQAQLRGPAEWHGIHDDEGRLVVAINFNMDMGDAWEHADDPVYPVPMTSLAYRFAVNYVIYAMTH